MPLGTLDRTPPPFFRQGPSAFTRLVFFSALSLFLMVADTRFKVTQPLRAVVATALNPVERVLRAPVDAWVAASDYLMGLQEARSAEAKAKRLVLTHLSSRHDVDPRPLLEQARQEFSGPCEIAFDGFSVELPLRE